MRALLVSVALLVALSAVPAPAAALSSCASTWTGSGSCTFVCDDVNLYIRGYAQNAGATASVTVTAECGLVAITGVFVPIQTLTCSASGPGSATCFTSAPYAFFPTPLVGMCTVSGSAGGAYACVSAP
ncbi:MAG TPA: hypothetical protein VFH78_02120 [Candidatus Thermoplasmatota archaeon]|nr:hypothetical protein [Candidatus Thermoplasmatota archaeon]